MSDLTPLSASKIKKAQSCSWSYWATYHLKIPDKSNDGASRGWICHLIFELLGAEKHKKIYDEIILKDSIYLCDSIKRLVGYHAKKLNVNDAENLKMIDDMTMAGLHFDFFGQARGEPSEAISEQAFDISVDESDKLYRLRGFIDKLFFYKKDDLVVIRDFKSSKSVFKGKEATDNLQDLIYTLAVRKLFPSFTKRQVEFLFLKFDLHASGNLRMQEISESELVGLERYLTGVQAFLDQFDEFDAVSNFAGSQKYPSDGSFGGPLMCGKDGYKISKGKPLLNDEGNPIPAYICAYRKPIDFLAVKNKDGKIIKSYFLDQEKDIKLNQEAGEFVEKMSYSGCPYWQKPKLLVDDFL